MFSRARYPIITSLLSCNLELKISIASSISFSGEIRESTTHMSSLRVETGISLMLIAGYHTVQSVLHLFIHSFLVEIEFAKTMSLKSVSCMTNKLNILTRESDGSGTNS